MLNSNTIIWDGPSIPCLQLCEGDTVSDVIYNIAKQVCCIIDDLDTKDIDYSCIIDKSKTYGNVDLFLLFTLLLNNDCKIKDLIDAKIDTNDTTELLVDNLDLKCFLQPYLDQKCTIIRFNSKPDTIVNPNDSGNTVFQRAEIEIEGYFYVSYVDRSVWIWNGYQYELSNLPTNCVCEIEELDLDLKITLQVIINNLCQTKTNGIIKACDAFEIIPFNTIDPNVSGTVFIGTIQQPTSYYISNVTHKLWKWSNDSLIYIPSVFTSADIDLSSVDSCLLQAEVFLQNWLDQYKVYQEPLITSCLSSTPNILSNHVVNITDNNICSLQSNVGSNRDVYRAFLNSCSKIVTFTGDPNGVNMVFSEPIYNDYDYFYVNETYDYPFVWNGFQYVPYKRNLAQQESDQWDKVCDLLSRVKNIENTCCTPSCDGIKIKFSAIYNSEDGTFSLVFDSASGTVIPEDFTDCGSILTATDKNGTKVSLNIELTQDVIIDLDTSSLDLSSTVNVNIKSCLSNGTLTCKTCYSQSLPIIEKCGICKICAVDSSENGGENVIVYYTLASSPNVIQNTKLYGGQCLTFKLPEDNPTIKSIITSSSSISLENDPTYPCNDVAIPAPVANSCWFFEVPVTDTYTQIALKSIDTILANQTRLDFDFVESTNYRETYFMYLDYVNIKGVPLSGDIITAATFNNDNSYAGLGLPQGLPQNVTLMPPTCNSAYHKTWNIQGQGSDFIVTFQSSNNGGTGVFSQFAAGTFKLKYDITQDQNNTDRWGFILKIQGQPTNIDGVQKPEIAIKHPINGALTYIKGELLSDECECPS